MIQQFHFCIYTGKNRSQGREQILVLYSQHHYSQQPNEGDGPSVHPWRKGDMFDMYMVRYI